MTPSPKIFCPSDLFTANIDFTIGRMDPKLEPTILQLKNHGSPHFALRLGPSVNPARPRDGHVATSPDWTFQRRP
jgi:hypothetical protein